MELFIIIHGALPMSKLVKGSSEEEYEEVQINPSEHLSCFRYPKVGGGTVFQYYIMNEIISPHIYIQMFQEMRMSREDDDIFVYFNSQGGWVDTGLQFTNIVKESKGTVYTVLDGKAWSIASTMFLAGDVLLINENGSLMIHNYSTGVKGKGNDVLQTIQGYTNYITELFERIYKPFLTDDEFERVMDGKDYWFTSAQAKPRIDDIMKGKQLKALMNEHESISAMVTAMSEDLEEIADEIELLTV